MVVSADMVKIVPAAGVSVGDPCDAPVDRTDTPRFRGFATFGKDREASVILEVADTPELKAKGLMGRSSMPSCCGMLFTDLSGGYFWMKGCKMPLDIVFLDKSNIITRSYTMLPDNGAKRYAYDVSDSVAIELQSGFCTRHNIKIGTPCTWRVW